MKFSTQYDLYLGRDITVSDKQIRDFLRNHVTERFPGFTLTDAKGYWKGKPEPTLILTILGDSVDGFAVTSIAQAYNATFRQECVLVVETVIVGRLV